jgi:hypothetical protein
MTILDRALTVICQRGLLTVLVAPNTSDRQHLVALLSAVETPARAAELPADDGLIAVARFHRLSPLLSVTAGASLPSKLAETFRRDRLITAARNLVLLQVAQECLHELGRAKIPAIVLKGVAYEQLLYEQSGTRPGADVDLLVPRHERRRAFEVMDRLGFEPRASSPGFDDPDYHEVAWARPGAEVDLHMGLTVFARCRIDYGQVWSRAQPLLLGQTEALALHPIHAVMFQALHMAIDHFRVPAIYLVDLSRLLALAGDLDAVEANARAWHTHRSLETALALAAAFLPRWAGSYPFTAASYPASRVVAHYGPVAPLPRAEQLFRKLLHFDTVTDAVRYVAVQSRRKLREPLERNLRKRTARERLALPPSRSR